MRLEEAQPSGQIILGNKVKTDYLAPAEKLIDHIDRRMDLFSATEKNAACIQRLRMRSGRASRPPQASESAPAADRKAALRARIAAKERRAEAAAASPGCHT